MTADAISVRPANEAGCAELMAVFGRRGEPSRCLCQRMRLPHRIWHEMPLAERADRLRAATVCGDPVAPRTSGLVAFLDGEPVGWAAVEPRTVYRRLHQPQATVVWEGRAEDKADASVWAVACFCTRAGFRRRGVAAALARAAVPFAREGGARALEGYPLLTRPGQEVSWGELHVGTVSIFAAAGLREVSRPGLRRAVMRIDFA